MYGSRQGCYATTQPWAGFPIDAGMPGAYVPDAEGHRRRPPSFSASGEGAPVRPIRAATAALIVAGVGACSPEASDGRSPSPPTTPSPDIEQGAAAPIAFSEFWRRRDDLAG